MSDLYLCLCTVRKWRKNATRTGRGECGEELDPARTIVDYAVPTADAIVASRGDNAGATRAEPHEQVAQRYCIVFREILLDVAIRRADRLWDLWLVDHVFEPLEVALLASADGAVVDEWGRVRASDASVYWVSTFASWLGSPGTRRFPPRICTRVNVASSPSMRCLFMKVVRSSLLG